VDLLFHSTVVDVLSDGPRVSGLVVGNKRGLEIVPARVVVDCSGDADVVAHAGGSFTFGRELDRLTQPASRVFRVGDVDMDRVWDYLANHPEDRQAPEGWAGREYDIDRLRRTPGAVVEAFASLVRKARDAGDFNVPRKRIALITMPGRRDVTVNVTRVHGVDGTDPDQVTRAEVVTQLQMAEVIRFLRKYVPGFERAHITSSPYQIGVRESRHINGRYQMTKDDVLEGRDFEDQVGRGAYPLDIHDPQAEATVLGQQVKGTGVTLWPIKRSFGIPMRSLLPVDLENVTVGGRCVSATHEAAGSVRGQAVCMVTGHAAGTIAALAAIADQTPASLDVSDVQATLEKQDAVLTRTQLITSD
jgi:hypothetical protein